MTRELWNNIFPLKIMKKKPLIYSKDIIECILNTIHCSRCPGYFSERNRQKSSLLWLLLGEKFPLWNITVKHRWHCMSGGDKHHGQMNRTEPRQRAGKDPQAPAGGGAI